MNELLKVNFENEVPTVSARELYKFLEVQKRFSQWFETNSQGFIEIEDFTSVPTSTVVNNGALRELDDYQISLDMAKHICLMSRTEKGKKYRQYLIKVEEKWNSPESILARAYEISKKQLESIQIENAEFKLQIEELKPKALFADSVATSKTSILVGELAKLLKQNGVDIGQNRLFDWLRKNGFIMSRSTMPTQRSMEMGLMEIKERTIADGNGVEKIVKTTKITGKGQVYFINRFLNA